VVLRKRTTLSAILHTLKISYGVDWGLNEKRVAKGRFDVGLNMPEEPL